MKDTVYWRKLAEEGPIREFQEKLERESKGLNLRQFAEKWSEILGYSESSIMHWSAGTRTIPDKAIKAVGIEVAPPAKKSTLASSENSSIRGMKDRQKVINAMCAGCALGDRFCRISDCPLRPFSPLPLHPKAITMGWDEEQDERP